MEDMLAILKDARARISDESNWCQEAYARDQFSGIVPWDSEQAVQWCASGSLRKSVKTIDSYQVVLHTVRKVNAKVFPGPITLVNDEKGHKAVLSCFDRAIENLEREK